MGEQETRVHARFDGEYFRCGVCGDKLARKVKDCLCTTESNPEMENTGYGLEIKCRHREHGAKCGVYNLIPY
jgi:hypothetical protein